MAGPPGLAPETSVQSWPSLQGGCPHCEVNVAPQWLPKQQARICHLCLHIPLLKRMASLMLSLSLGNLPSEATLMPTDIFEICETQEQVV